jgi:hypothetical protein
VDAALEYSFRFDIPFLPQLPALNPRELMVHQALAGFPGILSPEKDNSEVGAVIVLEAWQAGRGGLHCHLDRAFTEASRRKNAFEDFLPRQEDYRALRPFLWEVSERKVPQAKLQMAGPITVARSLRARESLRLPEDLLADLQKFLLARALALLRMAGASGARSLFFLDEPWLFALNPIETPRDALSLRELGFFVEALKKEGAPFGASIGIHCCSDPDWQALLGTVPLDILSVDASVSLHSLVGPKRQALLDFTQRGGRMAWGVIPSNLETPAPPLFEHLSQTDELRASLKNALLTPACGLAFHSTLECEEVAARLDSKAREQQAPNS